MNDQDGKLNQYLFKEVEFIQNIINRMAHNSFLIKGWTVTLVAITLLLRGIPHQVFIAFIPLIVFWFLDAYYLQQERLYRLLYDWVRDNRMKTEEHLLDMNAYRFSEQVHSRLRIMTSSTLFPFYGSISLLVILYTLIIFST